MAQIEKVPVIGGLAKIVAAPFKLVGDTGMAVGSLFTGDTNGFKNGLGGMVNDVIDVPSGVIDCADGIVSVPQYALGGQSSDNTSGMQKITMGTGNAMDIPRGVLQIGNEALDAIRPSRRGFSETYGNVPTPQAQPTQKTQKTTTVTTTTTTTQVKDDETQKSDGVIHVESPIKDRPDRIQIELRDNVSEAQQTNEALTGTIQEAKQTDEDLKGTIGEAKQADTALRDSIDQANKANDELKNNIRIFLDNKKEENQPVAEAPKKDKKFNWKLWGTVAGVAAAVGLAFLFRGKIKNLFKNRKLAKALKNKPDAASKIIAGKPSPVSAGQVIEGTPSVISTEQILPNSVLKKAAKQPQYTLANKNFKGTLSVKADTKIDDILKVADQKIDTASITIKAKNLNATAATPTQKLLHAGDDTIDLVKVGNQYVPTENLKPFTNGTKPAEGAQNLIGASTTAGSTNKNISSASSAIQMMEQENLEIARAQKLNRFATAAETNKGQKASNDIKNWMQGQAEQAKVQAQKAEAKRIADAQKKVAEIEAKEQEAMLEKYKARIARRKEAAEAKKASKEARRAANAQKVAAKEAAEKEYSEALKRNKALTQAPDKANQATFDALREDIISRSKPSELASLQQKREELDRAAKLNRLATEAETNKGKKASNDIKNWMQGQAEQAKVQAQKAEAKRIADAQKKVAEIEAKEKEEMLEKYTARINRKKAADEAKKANKAARKAANAQKVAAKEAAEKEYSEALKHNKALTQAPDKANQATFDALREDIIARSKTQPKYPPLSESGRNLFPAWNNEQKTLLDEAGEIIKAQEAAKAADNVTSVVSNKRVLTTVTSGKKVNLEQLSNFAGQKVKVRLNPNGVPKKELASLQSSFRSLMGGKANALPKNAAVVEVEINPSTLGQIRKLYKHLQITAA